MCTYNDFKSLHLKQVYSFFTLTHLVILPDPYFIPILLYLKVKWPDIYQSSELAESNRAYADKLVERDIGTLPPLHVEGGLFAADFKTQV